MQEKRIKRNRTPTRPIFVQLLIFIFCLERPSGIRRNFLPPSVEVDKETRKRIYDKTKNFFSTSIGCFPCSTSTYSKIRWRMYIANMSNIMHCMVLSKVCLVSICLHFVYLQYNGCFPKNLFRSLKNLTSILNKI